MLHAFLVLVLLALAEAADGATPPPAAPAAERVLKANGVTLRLQQSACSLPHVLATIQQIYHDRFRDGEATGPGGSIRFCWTDIELDGQVSQDSIYVMDTEGGSGWVSLQGFKPQPVI